MVNEKPCQSINQLIDNRKYWNKTRQGCNHFYLFCKHPQPSQINEKSFQDNQDDIFLEVFKVSNNSSNRRSINEKQPAKSNGLPKKNLAD